MQGPRWGLYIAETSAKKGFKQAEGKLEFVSMTAETPYWMFNRSTIVEPNWDRDVEKKEVVLLSGGSVQPQQAIRTSSSGRRRGTSFYLRKGREIQVSIKWGSLRV